MKKMMSFLKLLFFSVFATTKMLENVEEDWAKLTGEKDQKPNTKPSSSTATTKNPAP